MTLKVPDGARREIKFYVSSIHRTTITHWLRLHSAGFGHPYPDRWVNNVYFDTHDYGAFGENLLGASSRSKVRYRWYGKDQVAPGPGVLEVKQKRNSFGWKLRFPIKESPCHSGDDWRGVRKRLRGQLTPEGRLWLDANPQSVLINRYLREYFLSGDGRIRMTIDSHQRVWDQRKRRQPNFTHPTEIPDNIVLEVKFDRGDRDVASRFIHGLPIRVSRHSKYVMGVESLRGF